MPQFSQFNGDDPIGWFSWPTSSNISIISQMCKWCNKPPCTYLEKAYCGFNRWIKHGNHGIIEIDIINMCYVCPTRWRRSNGNLSKFHQTTTFRDYQTQYGHLVNQTLQVVESFLVGYCLWPFRDEVSMGIKMFQLSTLVQAFKLLVSFLRKLELIETWIFSRFLQQLISRIYEVYKCGVKPSSSWLFYNFTHFDCKIHPYSPSHCHIFLDSTTLS